MGRQYTPDELLGLRDSPLVRKPSNLPPAEEWMGPPQEQNQRKTPMPRTKPDEPPVRPSLLETKHASRASSSVPEDIILAPPRTSFASATSLRNLNKASDSLEKSSSTPHDEDSSKSDRFSFRDKSFRERDRSDRENERSREPRSRVNGRRGGREDGEGWTSVKSRKSFGQEDNDRFPRRNGVRDIERDREIERDQEQRPQRTYDKYGRDKERDESDTVPHRNGLGRGRNEPSWFRDENPQANKERDAGKEVLKDREWRDKDRGATRGGDREWARGARIEQDPEWMDEPEREDPKQAHTQEDFQRWKERMKASSAPLDEKPKIPDQQEIEQGHSGLAMDQVQPQKVDTPIVINPGIDRFFGLWDEPKRPDSHLAEDVPPLISRKESAKAPVGRASRFTSFFNPQEEPPRGQTATPPPSKPPPGLFQDSSNEDKEGFQRILQMLGGTNVSSEISTPQANPSQQPQLPVEDNQRSIPSTITSSLGQNNEKQGRSTRQDQTRIRARNSAGLESLLGPQSPQGGGQPNRDSEFLLKLMQQSRPSPGLNQSPSRTGQAGNDSHQGPSQVPGILSRPKEPPKSKVPSVPQQRLFEDPSMSLGRHHNENAWELNGEQGFSGPPPGFPDEIPPLDFMRRQSDLARESAKTRTPRNTLPEFINEPSIPTNQRRQAPDIPQGLSNQAAGPPRPPGLDQMPPSWPNNQLPPQHQGHIPPPPGFVGTARGPNNFSPGFPRPLGNMPPLYADRGPSGNTVIGPGQAHLPPGMPPPPGFFGISGPPPGFPPLPFVPENMLGASVGGALRRPQFEMHGDGVNMGPNGRGVPPGQYRR
ncbi:MAG: hypothetical protein M1827_002262 [Pycnora praestabilis]|nr:MAG: hypothetical protein M1827_002262 [Pycnora praestabilis]